MLARFQRAEGLAIASDIPTLTRAEVWTDPLCLSLSLGRSLPTSVAVLKAHPSLCPGQSALSPGPGGGCSVTRQAVRPAGPVCLCDSSCPSRILCRCHSPAPAWGPACLPGLPAPYSAGSLVLIRAPLPGSAAEAPGPSGVEFRGVGWSRGAAQQEGFARRALGKGPPQPPALIHPASPGFPNWAALFTCQMAPARLPRPRALRCPFVHPLLCSDRLTSDSNPP